MPYLPRHVLPKAPRDARIGLFGGSFDPAHSGHVHVSRQAMMRLDLDLFWWLVSPGNPLKPHGPAPLGDRMAHARGMITHPRMHVTGIEAALGTRYTAHTLRRLRALYPTQAMVWVMGADNLAQMHQWQDWRAILSMLPIAVIARPGQQRRALSSPVARVAARHRLPARKAAALPMMQAPAWCFLTVPMRDISSSSLRQRGIRAGG